MEAMSRADISRLVSQFLNEVPGVSWREQPSRTQSTADKKLMSELMPVLKEYKLFMRQPYQRGDRRIRYRATIWSARHSATCLFLTTWKMWSPSANRLRSLSTAPSQKKTLMPSDMLIHRRRKR